MEAILAPEKNAAGIPQKSIKSDPSDPSSAVVSDAMDQVDNPDFDHANYGASNEDRQTLAWPSRIHIPNSVQEAIRIKGYRKIGRPTAQERYVEEVLPAVTTTTIRKGKFFFASVLNVERGTYTPSTRRFVPNTDSINSFRWDADAWRTILQPGTEQHEGLTAQMVKGGIPASAFDLIANTGEVRIGTGGLRVLLNILASKVLNYKMVDSDTDDRYEYAGADQIEIPRGSIYVRGATEWSRAGSLESDLSTTVGSNPITIVNDASLFNSVANNDGSIIIISQDIASGITKLGVLNLVVDDADIGDVYQHDSGVWVLRGNLDSLSAISTITSVTESSSVPSSFAGSEGEVRILTATIAAVDNEARLSNFPLGNLHFYPRWGGTLYFAQQILLHELGISDPTPFTDLTLSLNQNYEADEALTGSRERGQPIVGGPGVKQFTLSADVYVVSGNKADYDMGKFVRWQDIYTDNQTERLELYSFNYLDNGRQYLIKVEGKNCQLTTMPVLTVEGRAQMNRRLEWKLVPVDTSDPEERELQVTIYSQFKPFAAA